jgi:hypothetical protein
MVEFGDEWYFRVGAFCFIEWGLVHIVAMILIMPPAWNGRISAMFVGGEGNYLSGLYPGRPTTEFKSEYDNMAGKWPAYTGKVLSHHGLNLGWIGVWSIWIGFKCLQDVNEMTWVLALVPFLADVGYWIHYDWFELGGIPGEMQTFIISLGLYCTGLAMRDNYATPYVSESVMLGVPMVFVAMAVTVKVLMLAGMWPYTGEGSKATPPECWDKESTVADEAAGTEETEFLTIIKMKL